MRCYTNGISRIYQSSRDPLVILEVSNLYIYVGNVIIHITLLQDVTSYPGLDHYGEISGSFKKIKLTAMI